MTAETPGPPPPARRRHRPRRPIDSSAALEWAGPWSVHPCAWNGQEGFGVFHVWENRERDLPRAWFHTRHTADLAAALLPALGQKERYGLAGEPDRAGGQRVDDFGRPAGYLLVHGDRITAALNLADYLLHAPASLALLLTAAGPQVLIEIHHHFAAAASRPDGEP